MTNILTHTLPVKIETENGIFEPVTDFRASIEFETMVDNGEHDIYKLMQPYYPKGLPKQLEVEAVNAALWFYQCGDDDKDKTENKPLRKTKRAYSFSFDAAVIYSDFSRYYNIDLTSAKLHWWKFRALLAGLPNESSFKERIYYRTCDLKGLPKKEQKRICEIRKLIEIKEEEHKKISLEKRNADMLAYVQKRQRQLTKGVE